MNLSITAGDLSITPRELLAGVVAVISLCGSLAFGYGVKATQIDQVQSIVVKQNTDILQLRDELVLLRIAVAELNVTIARVEKK